MGAPKDLLPEARRSGGFSRLRVLISLVLSAWSLAGGLTSIAVFTTLVPAVAAPPTEKPALPQAPEIPAGHESYLRRPDILKLKPQSHPELGKDWESLKRGHAEAVAMMLEMYPDRELYFLARDSELLYDLAKIVAQGHPEQQKRLHLLNVSRANMRDPHVREYLAQEGISEASLKAGKKVLFVDTGFSGTIPRVISELFPENLRRQLETQLMCSSNKAHPSMRGFLAAINPAAPGLPPGSLHGSIVSYEHMPRFTDRSTGFAQVQGRWEPISPQGKSNDGQVSPQKAQAHQEDLRAYTESAEAKALMAQRRTQWKKLRELSQAPDPTNDALVAELRALLAAHPKDPFTEALARDFLDLRETNLAPNSVRPPLSASDLGLSEVVTGSGGSSNKNALVQKYPEWASVLENPQTGIAKLIESGEWGKLGAITDAIQDKEFTRVLTQALSAPASAGKPGLKAFVGMLIEKGDPLTLQSLAHYFFAQPHAAGMEDSLKLLIEKGDPIVLRNLAIYTFSKPHAAGMEDLLKLLIEKGDPVSLGDLARFTFSQPHTAGMTESLRVLIEKGDPIALRNLAEHTFSKPHTAQMKDLLKLLIEKGKLSTLQTLAMYTFPQPHATEMKDLLKLLIEKGDSSTLQILARYTFPKSHATEMKDLLKLLIEKNDHLALRSLAMYAFVEPHATEMKDSLKLLIEKGDSVTLRNLAIYTFSKPHAAGMEDSLKLLIEKGDPVSLGDLATFTFSQPHTAGMTESLRVLIEKGDPIALRNLAEDTFSKPHTAQMKDLLKLVIEKGDPGTLQTLAMYTFLQPHTTEMKDLLKLLIEKGDPVTLRSLAHYFFAQPHAAGMEDSLKLLIEKGDPVVLRNLAVYTFPKPHAAGMEDSLKLLIDKGDSSILRILAAHTFSQPHAAEMKDLLKFFIEKGDPVTLQILADHALQKPHWKGPEHDDLRKAVQIQDPVARKAFLQNAARPVPTLASGAVTSGKITPSLKSGDTVATPSGRTLRVLEFVDEGKRGRVYRVRDEGSGQLLALKVARDAEAETLASLAQEPEKAKLYQKLGLPHASVVETQPEFVLKDWVEGTRADAWMKSWMADGAPKDAPQILALRKLLERSAERGAYIGDLNAKNLIWRDPEWVVIDSGGVREGLSVEEAWGRYIEKIPARWGKKAGGPAAAFCLAQALQLLTSPHQP